MNYTIYNGIVTYNTLLPEDALDFAFFNNDLDGIKYISARQGLNYVDKIYDRYKGYQNWESSSLSRATKLKDFRGIKSFYAKMGSSSESLYDAYYNIEHKKEAAAEFRDLRGLYCIWLSENFFCALQDKHNYTFHFPPKFNVTNGTCTIDNATFLTQFKAFPDIHEIKRTCSRVKNFQEWIYNTHELGDDDLHLAIELNDLDAISLMQQKQNEDPKSINISKEKLTSSLNFAYHKKNLALAEEIIELGAEFKPIYMFRPNRPLKKEQYEQHIKSLTVSSSEKDTALSIIDLMFLKPLSLSKSYNNICFVIDSIANNSYTPDLNIGLFTSTMKNLIGRGYIISGILTYIALLNHPKTQHTPLKIFILKDLKAAFRRDVIKHPHKDYCIHSEAKILNSELVHEAAHALLYTLFDNDCKPFSRMDEISKTYRYAKYKEAELNTILNFCNFIGETPKYNCLWHNKSCYKSLIRHLSSIPIDLTMIRTLGWYDRIKSNPDNHSINFQGYTQILAKDYYIHSKKKGRTDFKKYLTHEARVEFLKDAIEREGWSWDKAILLQRFHECLSRDRDDIERNIETELIVRLPELLASGNTAVSELFSPLKQYWEEFISPEIENSIKLFNIDECNSISCIDECRSEIEKTHYTQPQEDPKPYWSPYYDFMFSMLEYLTVDECGLSNPQNHNRLESGEIPKSSWSLPSITDFFSYFTTSNSDTAGEVKEDEEV